jgi:methylated-DNA-[protein]-cysteine S-methyltransferase
MSAVHTTIHTTIDSPLGELTLVADGKALTGLYFARQWYRPDPATFGPPGAAPVLDVAAEQLTEYFTGDRTAFEVPVAPRGDAFQRRVWELVSRIPYGRTRTYGALARELGDPALAREVGGAVGRNPLAIVVPCHRVVGADGRLTGYAGGLDRKRYLLDLESPALVGLS